MARNALSFDFNAEVERVWRENPETRDSLFFAHVSEDTATLVYPGDKDKREEHVKRMNGFKSLPRVLAKGSAGFHFSSADSCRKGLITIARDETSMLLNKAATKAQHKTQSLDHELGHALIPEGTGKDENLAECVADAYSVIRHFQRYGASSALIDSLVSARAFSGVVGDDDQHFTAPVVAALLKHRHKIAWNALSPQDTQRLAVDFARKYQMPAEQRKALHAVFAESRAALENGDGMNWVTVFPRQVLETSSPDAFRWGAVILLGNHGVAEDMERQLRQRARELGVRGRLKYDEGKYRPGCYGNMKRIKVAQLS